LRKKTITVISYQLTVSNQRADGSKGGRETSWLGCVGGLLCDSKIGWLWGQRSTEKQHRPASGSGKNKAQGYVAKTL